MTKSKFASTADSQNRGATLLLESDGSLMLCREPQAITIVLAPYQLVLLGRDCLGIAFERDPSMRTVVIYEMAKVMGMPEAEAEALFRTLTHDAPPNSH